MNMEAAPSAASILEAVPFPFGLRELRGDAVVHVADNSAAARLFSRTPEETRGKTATELGMTAQQSRACASVFLLARERREAVQIPTRYQTPEGVRDMICHAKALSGASARFACLLEDVTDRTRMENALAHTERLSSIGTLTAALIHDMAGPATAATVLLDESVSRVERAAAGAELEPYALLEDLLGAQAALKQLVAVLRTVRSYTQRAGNEMIAACNLDEVVESTLRLVKAEAGGKVHLTFEAGAVPRVRASAVRLAQVILNLVSNAVRAAGADRPSGAGCVTVRTVVREGLRIQLEIADDGPGLGDAEAHLFQAFATQNAECGGTGLGLFISKRIIDSFGGTIQLTNQPRGGTLATVTLLPAKPGT